MRKQSAALLIAAVMLCGCRARPSDAPESVSSETEQVRGAESNTEESAEVTLPESIAPISREVMSEPPVTEEIIIPVLTEESECPK